MPELETIIAAAILGSLTIYALTAGADFGGGFWDLVASGPRRAEQRRAISEAIGPIWEANHVWLILVVVLMFTAFPGAFATIVVTLHIPLSIALLGIVFRGAAFVFRAYGEKGAAAQRWGRVFGWASTITPVALGVCLASVSSETVGLSEHYQTWPGSAQPWELYSDFISPWLRPFPFMVGAFVLALFAFLAAVYLANEAKVEAVREAFRRRALASALVVGLLAQMTLAYAKADARRLYEHLTGQSLDWRYHMVVGLMAAGAIWALWRRAFRMARTLAVGQVAFIVVGWGIAMNPCLIVPYWTTENCAAPRATLVPLAWALGIGALFLFPSFYYLLRVFKGREAFDLTDRFPK